MISIELGKLNLVRRYLLAALIAALIPLITIAVLYDRYSATLLNSLIADRIDANLEAVAAKMSHFMAVQVNRLENIIDLPDTTEFFTSGTDPELSHLLKDILLLEAESPDIYAIELMDIDGNILQTVPALRSQPRPQDYTQLPFVQHNGVDVLGPVLPRNGRPGYFLIRMAVIRDHQKIGLVTLRTRLASLTEQVASLVEPDVYDPQIIVFDRIRLTPVGTEAQEQKVLARSRQFFPGWRIQLVEGTDNLQEPRTQIRYFLLFAALISMLVLVWLFFKMSSRLSGYLLPLNEGAKAVANGNFGVSVPEDAPGELGTLARSYNRMREQLEALIKSRVDVERRAALGSMAAGIAHEIRNPLTTISTTVHGLNRGETSPDRQQMYEVISSEITRVDKTIGEFLNYAKPSDPIRERVLIRDIFRSIRTLVASTAHRNGITVNLSGDSNLEIRIDQAHLKQILLNLSLNAIQAMPDGGLLTLKTFREEGRATIIVSDNGVGLDEQTKPKILRPFFTTRQKGTGLGLSITSQLVETNLGRMTIDSKKDVGTTVTLTFPLGDLDDGDSNLEGDQ